MSGTPDGPAPLPRLTLGTDLPPVILGIAGAAPVAVGPAGEALNREIEASCRALRGAHAGLPPSEIPGLAPARDLYRAFGIDPTRTRPSSEALLRRILQEKPFPRILNAVDVINLLAVRFLLSIGLYDADRVRGDVVFRRGRPGESFPGIRKEEVHLEGRPVLADADGPFGNPTSDSLRTAVTGSTRSIVMVIFAPGGFPRAAMEEDVRQARAALERHLGAPAVPVLTAGAVLPAGAALPAGADLPVR